MSRRSPRTDETKIEDMFFDLKPSDQERVLATLEKLHRLKKRQPGAPTEANEPLLERATA